MSYDIGVVGAGTAGCAAAIELVRSGHQVTVYEAVDDPQPVGAGLLIQPTGQAALSRLGVIESILRAGAQVHQLAVTTCSGRTVLDLDYAGLDDELFGVGLHRGVLFEALFDKARRVGVSIHCGEYVVDLEETPDGVALQADGGVEHGPHDLVIVADGADSQLRDATPIGPREDVYPWGALWFIGEDRDVATANTLVQRVDGTRRMLGLLPTGRGPHSETPLVSLFWSVRVDQIDEVRQRGLSAWKREVRELTDEADSLLEQIESMDQLLDAEYHLARFDRWHTDRVVFIGDAAHAMSPQLGQGCNLALVDAVTLADCVEQAPGVCEALKNYSKRRRAHVGYYQFANGLLTPFFQSEHTILGWLRDTFMGVACRLPVLRGQMLRTLAGVKRGIVRPSIPLSKVRRRLPYVTEPGQVSEAG